MNNWKLVLTVVGGSLAVLVLMAWGLGQKQGTTPTPSEVVRVEGVEGGARLVKGSQEPKVTIVEFSDFQCPACRATQPLVEKIVKENPDVRLVYRHMPLYSVHPNAEMAAIAAEAANAQGKFWEFHDWLFVNQSSWAEEKDPIEKFKAGAAQIGLEGFNFSEALKEKRYKDMVDADYQAALGFGVNATPTFYVNGIKASNVDLEATVKRELENGN